MAPGLWHRCRNELCSQNLWRRRCNRGTRGQGEHLQKCGTTARSFQPEPSFWSGIVSYSPALLTAPVEKHSHTSHSTTRKSANVLICWSRQEQLSWVFGSSKVQNGTDATFDLHALHILLLGVFKDDVREVCSRYQALDMVGQMHHHPTSYQDRHCPLGQEDTLWDRQQNQEWNEKWKQSQWIITRRTHVHLSLVGVRGKTPWFFFFLRDFLTSTTWPAWRSWYLKKGL